VVPGVEHISILFSSTAHSAARDWLEAAFGRQPGAVTYRDWRIVWYGLGMLGTFAFFWALAPLVGRALPVLPPPLPGPPARPLWRRLGALLGGALGATLSLWALEKAGLELSGLFGLLVGGYLILWFGVAGVISWLLLGLRPERFSAPDLIAGGLAFAALWLGV
jgi:hypothetical protein